MDSESRDRGITSTIRGLLSGGIRAIDPPPVSNVIRMEVSLGLLSLFEYTAITRNLYEAPVIKYTNSFLCVYNLTSYTSSKNIRTAYIINTARGTNIYYHAAALFNLIQVIESLKLKALLTTFEEHFKKSKNLTNSSNHVYN